MNDAITDMDIGFNLRLLHQPALADAEALFTRAAQDGANAVALVTHNYVHVPDGTVYAQYAPAEWRTKALIEADWGQNPQHPYENTTGPLLVRKIAAKAEEAGLQVMIKPHIDAFYGGWRYFVQFEHVAYRFQAEYRRFLRPYLDIAKDLANPLFCMGTELGSVTFSQNRYLGVAFWQRTARWIRSEGYHGPLTYAANWGQEADALADLWAMPEITMGGIDGYYPLQWGDNPPPSPSYEELLAAWDQPSAQLPRLAQAAGKPFVFTEIGLSNYTLAARNPGADAPQGATRDDTLQADYYRAFRTRFDNEPGYGGFFCWEMFLGQQPDISHSIVDRPAEAIAFRQEAA